MAAYPNGNSPQDNAGSGSGSFPVLQPDLTTSQLFSIDTSSPQLAPGASSGAAQSRSHFNSPSQASQPQSRITSMGADIFSSSGNQYPRNSSPALLLYSAQPTDPLAMYTSNSQPFSAPTQITSSKPLSGAFVPASSTYQPAYSFPTSSGPFAGYPSGVAYGIPATQVGSPGAPYSYMYPQFSPQYQDYLAQYHRQQVVKSQHADQYKRQVEQLQRESSPSPSPTGDLNSSMTSMYDSGFIEAQRRELEKYAQTKSGPGSSTTSNQSHSLYPKLGDEVTVDSLLQVASNEKEVDLRDEMELNKRIVAAHEFVDRAKKFKHADSTLWQLRYVFPNGPNIHKKTHCLVSSKGKREPLESRVETDWLLLPEPKSAPPFASGLPQSLIGSGGMGTTQFLSRTTMSQIQQSLMPAEVSKSTEIMHTLYADIVNIDELRAFCLGYGVPKKVRAFAWQILLGYLPLEAAVRNSYLKERRKHYYDLVEKFYPVSESFSRADKTMLNLVCVDVPRTHPDNFLTIFDTKAVQQSLERVLYVWSCKHPNVSYYQGLNDLASIFFVVFLDCCLGPIGDSEIADNPGALQNLNSILACVEPDVYWCLSIVLQQLEAHFEFARGGVYSEPMIHLLEKTVDKLTPALAAHFKKEELAYMHFAFRWMLCLFTRELDTKNLVSLWDSYISEGMKGFSEFHVLVCAAYLAELSGQLITKDMTQMMYFLQHAPTTHFTKQDIHRLVSKAYEIQQTHPLNLTTRTVLDTLDASMIGA